MPTISVTSTHKHSEWPVIMAILLVALNLRPTLATIGPLLDEIQHATGLGNRQAGLLTTLPVLAMGICALLGVLLHRSLGEYQGVALGAGLISTACALRWALEESTGLIVTAGLGGLGIALVQALLPGYIKRYFPQKTGPLMGLYTTGIMGGAAVAAASAAPLSHYIGWINVLALWAIPAALSTLIWLKIAVNKPMSIGTDSVRLPFQSKRA
ncbi:CP family cyanate transporter-like MFS transporter [Pseudomonas duriflava]|uniref:CP family cyanate transporter-like MFS transporter n=1 Tax=Pseudomonas duriflava TaxID=459528 RepID=A0A562Q7I5_9PSED|nr:CP family cyanate transporter-like MFS transporter [Pseudomonas duriflava]